MDNKEDNWSPQSQPRPESPGYPASPQWFSEPSVQPGRPRKSPLPWLIIGGILLAFILLTLSIGVTINKGVSEKEYRAADAAVDSLREDYIKVNTFAYDIDVLMTPEETTKNLTQLRESKRSFDKKFDVLATNTAIAEDEALKKDYMDIQAKKPAFDSMIDTVIEAHETVLPVIFSYEGIHSSFGSETVDKSLALRQELESIKDLRNESNKSFVQQMLPLARALETEAKNAQAAQGGIIENDSEAPASYTEVVSDMSDTIRTWQTDLTTTFDKTDISEGINTLNDATFAKAEEKAR